jgi:hypothetical protein
VYKCIDLTTNEPVISLDDKGPQWVDDIRNKSRGDFLHCPICNEPVTFRMGQKRRPHFAHKDLSDCPIQNESVEMLEARAVLYKWLGSKFQTGVTIEKQVEGSQLPRPFDCWVEHKGRAFGYWLVEKRFPEEVRVYIESVPRRARAELVWVFMARMLRRLEQKPRHFLLSTTERNCIMRTQFEEVYAIAGSGSLHYLDADAASLTTLRACRCVHSPQVYSGHELATPLGSLLISPRTGAFVHPGEYEKLKELGDKLQRGREQLLELRAQERERRNEEQRKRLEFERGRPLAYREAKPSQKGSPQPPVAPAPIRYAPSPERQGECEECGRITSDWWSYDGKTGKCKCNDCRRKMESERQNDIDRGKAF